MLQPLAGKPLIAHTYWSAKNSGAFDQVFVVTDSELIQDALKRENIDLIFDQSKDYKCGSDRVAGVSHGSEAEIIVNLQGDEPFLHKELFVEIVDTLEREIQNPRGVRVVSAMIKGQQLIDYKNPHCVKVVTDENHHALYFSRSPIPYHNADTPLSFFYHIGIYAFERHTLWRNYRNNPSGYEVKESLEMLRLLERGEKIKMVTSEREIFGINIPEDLEKAQKLFS